MKITAIIHPNSRNPRIETDLTGTLHIHVNAPPLEGKANLAAIEALAKHFSQKKSAVKITHGLRSKIKTFSIG